MVDTVVETFGVRTIQDFRKPNTGKMIPMLVDALEEQRERIEKLKADNVSLKEIMNDIEPIQNILAPEFNFRNLLHYSGSGKATNIRQPDSMERQQTITLAHLLRPVPAANNLKPAPYGAARSSLLQINGRTK